MPNIFEITQEYLSIIAEVEEAEGELSEELAAKLEINEENRNYKIQSYVNVIKIKQGEISTIDKEIERLKAVKESREKLIEKLKSVLLSAVKLFGETGKTGNKQLQLENQKLFTKTSKSLEIDIIEAIKDVELMKLLKFMPEPISYTDKVAVLKQFPNFEFTPKYDKVLIKDLILKDNKEFKGCKIVTKESINGL